MANIAFFSIYAYGHTNPTLPVVRELVRRGHRVRYYSFTPFQGAIEGAGAEFVLCDPYLPPPPKDLDKKVGKDFAALIEMNTETTLNMEEVLKRDLEEFQPDGIVSDSMCFWGKLAAARLGVPYVCSTTTFAFNQWTAALMKPTFSQKMTSIFGMGRIQRCVKRLRENGYPVKDFLALIQNDNDTHTVVYTSAQFQPLAEEFSDKYAFIGPSLPAARHDPPSMDGEKQLYVSLGTVNNKNLSFYRACVEASRTLYMKVTLSVGEGTGLTQLGRLPANLSAYQRVNQLDVLSHTDVFLSHCGMNSVNESLYLGVPIVAFPQQSEQDMVARRVIELGAGVRLDSADPEAIRRAVLTVMNEPSYAQKAEEIANGFRASGGFRAGADKIESVIAAGKN